MNYTKDIRYDWILIGILPVILSIVSDRWMFLPVHYWYDPWGSLGAHLSYDFLLPLYPHSYSLTRLPSIIPHFFAYKFLTSYWAVVVTTLLKFYGCIVPLYWVLVELTKNRVASLIPIILLSFFPFFLSSLGWNYVDGFGLAYISLATAFLVAACIKENWKFCLFVTGFFQALMVFNYLFVCIFSVIHILIFVIYNSKNQEKSLWTCAFFVALGGFLATACLSCFSYYFGETILFFWPQIQAAIGLSSETHLVSGKSSVWYFPFMSWFPRSTFLFLTIFTLFLSVVPTYNHLKNKSFFDLKFLIILQFWLACSIYVMQDILGVWMLQNFFVACYLLPFSVLTLGIILSEKDFSLKRETFVIFTIMGVFLAIFSLKGNAAVIGRSWGCVIVHFGLSLIFGTLFLKASRQRYQHFYLFLTGLCLLLSFNRLTLNYEDYPYKNHDDHALLVDLHRDIRNDIPSDKSYLFWYNASKDALGGFFQPLACTFQGVLFSDKFPDTPKKMPSEDSLIILMSTDVNATRIAKETLNKNGYSLRILKEEKRQLGQQEFLLLAFLLKSNNDTVIYP